jgi:cytoskeletal protein CcmA (bactofilin family)
VTGDRGFDVQTAKDEDALVGVKPNNVSVESGEEATLFTITNQFNSDLRIDSVYLDAPAPNDLAIEGLSGTSMPLFPGEKHEIVGTISCDSDIEDRQVAVTIETETDSESVELTRNTKITCSGEADPCAGERMVISNRNNGAIDSKLTVLLKEEATQKGSVKADGCVILREGAEINGSVRVCGNVVLGEEAKITGSVSAGGDVSLDEGAVIKGSVSAGGNVSLGEEASIGGDVSQNEGSGKYCDN